MPSVGRFPCERCEYVATNRRMLSRHVVVAHSDKVYKCPICPFITRYAANWYRHKRCLHGVRKATTCEVCGFFASSTDDLRQHTEAEHQEYLPHLQQGENHVSPNLNETVVLKIAKENDDEEVPSNEVTDPNPINGIHNSENTAENDSVTFSLPLGGFLENDYNFVDDQEEEKQTSPKPLVKMDLINQNYGELSPPKIRRSYCCNLCGLLTSNPREFLYHQRDIHGMRVNVFECKLCIYASKHVQKLQRHYGLVHRQPMPPNNTPPLPKTTKAKKTVRKTQFPARRLSFTKSQNSASTYDFGEDEHEMAVPQKSPPPKRTASILKCGTCNYQTKNKFLLSHHEKTVHLKKKFYRCVQCGYVTNEKARYTKHIKYHNLPKTQCEFCHFKSAYKWNMDRHMKSHTLGRAGEYNCTTCSFITHSQQSLKMHFVNHHAESNGVMDPSQENSSPESIGDSNESDWANSFQSDMVESAAFDYDMPGNQNSFSSDLNTEWNNTQNGSSKLLKCSSCDFQTKWSFELRRHEETHKSMKRHSCPLCGMRFEHIAWLTKHLNRIHKENAQAKHLAAAFELLKPNRRKPKQSPSNSNNFQPKKNAVSQMFTQNEKSFSDQNQSVLSSLLRNPGPSKYVSILPKANMNNNTEKVKLPLANSFTKTQVKCFENKTKVPPTKKTASRKIPNCRICGYKTKWISELEKHMRVHSDDKPFQCARCSYHSKWKGDLTRHMAKHHGVKLPMGFRNIPVPKVRLRKTVPSKLVSTNQWQTVDQESTNSDVNEQDSPLDLTVCRDMFQPLSIVLPEDQQDDEFSYESESALPSNSQVDFNESSDEEESTKPKKGTQVENDQESEASYAVVKKKYHCPFCNFITSTPSRFHVHIVQHYNKKPFMCSFCGHRSNWEWDITKHIRLRGCKDKDHNSACVLLTDETGRRNYEKYEKYLKPEVKSPPKATKTRERSRRKTTPEAVREKPKDSMNEIKPASLPQDNEAPVNIVVTPDLPFADSGMENADVASYSMGVNGMANDNDPGNGDFKFYLCKHCNYKHSSKKVVVGHLSIHAGIKPFRCRVCHMSANWRHIIVRHVKTAHNGYMNDVEDRITYIQEGYVIRITSVKDEVKSPGQQPASTKNAQYTCKFCPYKCDKEVYIKFHMKQHKPREGAIYQCNFCPYYVKFKKTLVRHLRLHDPPDQTFDQNENDKFSQENETFMHMQNVHENPTLELNDYLMGNGQMSYFNDDSIAINYDQLNSMEDSFSNDPIPRFKRHICDHCPYRTDNRTQYLYHKQFHRPNNSAPFKCTLCSYWASMQHLLTQHMKVHSAGDFPTDNDYDGNDTILDSVNYQESLGNDETNIPMVLVQRGGISTKMFKCRFCPMMNKKRANVRVHERMHGSGQGLGKYTCDFCNYNCSGQGSLTNHMKIHQGHEFDMKSFQQEQQNPEQVANYDVGNKRKIFSYFCMRCPAVFKSSSDLYIHRTFHGANLPFSCTQCDYRAKQKPHLQKHLQVHTEAYVSKRDASYGPPLNSQLDHQDNSSEFFESENNVPINKKVDQMLLLEVAEVKTYLRKGKEYAEKKMHKCPLCPSYFSKTAVLAYHCSLHRRGGQFSCNQCDYSTSRSENLSVHQQVHGKTTVVVKHSSKLIQCVKCPATFNKIDRYEKHLSLHGKKYRYVCDHCDYSVRFAANLSKHKFMHLNALKENENAASSKESTILQTIVDDSQNKDASPQKVVDGNFKLPELTEEKKIYTCDRCPYFQGRKDAVQSHQQRHFQKDGFQCPYCDYRSMGPSFLRDHVKSHIQPNNLFPPQAYMKCQQFKIWVVDGDSRQLLFEDKGTKLDLPERFYPPLQSREELLATGSVEEFQPIITMDNAPIVTKKKPASSNNSVRSTSKATESTNASGVNKKQKLLPKVILKDIFSERNVKKLDNGSVLINSTADPEDGPQETNSTSETSISPSTVAVKKTNSNVSHSSGSSEKAKSSIIVKIKVENIVEDNNERSLYTISKKSKGDTGSDAASDITIPVDDIDDLSNKSTEAFDGNDIAVPETLAEVSNVASDNDDKFENMTFSEVEPFSSLNSDTSMSNSARSAEGDMEFQENGTDFLKQLDFMVNNVAMKNSAQVEPNIC